MIDNLTNFLLGLAYFWLMLLLFSALGDIWRKHTGDELAMLFFRCALAFIAGCACVAAGVGVAWCLDQLEVLRHFKGCA